MRALLAITWEVVRPRYVAVRALQAVTPYNQKAVAEALPLRVLQRFSVLGFAPPSAAAFRFGRCVGRALRSKRSPL